jgi:ubiquinone/menaquinone biosynthesis C-methylase UbiE
MTDQDLRLKNPNDIFGCHNSEAKTYDERIYKDIKDTQNYIREKYFEVHKEVLRMAELKDGENILDIGIGTGLLEEKIKKKVHLYGIDISGKMMEKIKRKNLNPTQLKIGSFTKIPYKDKVFEAIVSCFAFHHLTDDEKVLSILEMKRVLKDKGRIVIGDLMYRDEKAKKMLVEKFRREKRDDVIRDMEEEYFTNVEWFSRKLEKNNFKISYKQLSTLNWVLKASL